MSVIIAAIKLRCTQGNYTVISSIVYNDVYDCVHHPQLRMSKQYLYEVVLMALMHQNSCWFLLILTKNVNGGLL